MSALFVVDGCNIDYKFIHRQFQPYLGAGRGIGALQSLPGAVVTTATTTGDTTVTEVIDLLHNFKNKAQNIIKLQELSQ